VNVELIVGNLRKNVAHARGIVAAVAGALPERTCRCGSALTDAIITPLDIVPDDVKRDLAPILERRARVVAS
jgi:hypothetical protein